VTAEEEISASLFWGIILENSNTSVTKSECF